jgi:hypothetical protein
MDTEVEAKPSGWRRVLWFVAIYGLSVAAVVLVVYGLKAAFGGLFG